MRAIAVFSMGMRFVCEFGFLIVSFLFLSWHLALTIMALFLLWQYLSWGIILPFHRNQIEKQNILNNQKTEQ